MPSKELIEEIAFIIRHDKDGSPEDTARDILEAIRAAQNKHIEVEIDGYIEDFRNMSRINGVHVTRALATLKRRLIDESPLGEQGE